MAKLKIFDGTLRDGSHAIKHQLTQQNIEDYCNAMDSAGMYTIIVGHGNGLGASSLQVGLSKLSDHEMLQTARACLRHTKLGVYMIPGFGTIRDNLIPAIEDGVDLFKIGRNALRLMVVNTRAQAPSTVSILRRCFIRAPLT